MSSQDHVFNQYFLDLLKKLKTKCKDKKEDSHEARVILRSIKKNYANNDTMSAAFREYMNSTDDNRAVWDAYEAVAADDAELLRWIDSNADVAALFRDVDLGTLKVMIPDSYMMHHYFTILNIFRVDMVDNEIAKVLDVLKSLGGKNIDDLIVNIESERVKSQLQRIVYIYSKRAEKLKRDPLVDNIAEIENTSLGKLAKEIMEEVNIDELQKTLGNGDIMSALANPDGGLVKLLGTVSQKMITKMSTGELKQENLLQDAMKLATKMGGGMGPFGDLASMFGGGGGSSDGGFDMSSLASMMGGAGAGKTRMRPNTANLKRMKKVKDLRNKLDQKRVKENVSVQVEEVDTE
jgi:hypothetical protein